MVFFFDEGFRQSKDRTHRFVCNDLKNSFYVSSSRLLVLDFTNFHAAFTRSKAGMQFFCRRSTKTWSVHRSNPASALVHALSSGNLFFVSTRTAGCCCNVLPQFLHTFEKLFLLTKPWQVTTAVAVTVSVSITVAATAWSAMITGNSGELGGLGRKRNLPQTCLRLRR